MILDESRLTHHYVMEIFNNKGSMSTVNFSVPEDVKNAFNTALLAKFSDA